MVERKAKDGIAQLDRCRIRSQIRIRATVGLNVGESALEQLFRTITRQILNDIDLLAATVIALAWIAFGILVGEHAAHRFHDRWRSEVLRSDQLDARTLTLELLIDRGCDLRVLCGKDRLCHAFLLSWVKRCCFTMVRSLRPGCSRSKLLGLLFA